MREYIVQENGKYGWCLVEIALNEEKAYEKMEKFQKQNPNNEYKVKVVENGWWNDQGLVK
jgi:hypothetical protein